VEFLTLFNRFISYDLYNLSQEEISSVLWGESSLLPEPGTHGLSREMDDFIDSTWKNWWRIRKENSNKLNWNMAGVRPLNNPNRRIAAVCIMIRNFGLLPFDNILKIFNSYSCHHKICKKFKETLACRDDLWDNYSSPYHKLKKKAAVLGESRALDIMVNVILPFIYAYSDIHSLAATKEKALSAWKCLPPCQSNIVLKICSNRWLIPHERAKQVFKSGAAQQGAMFISKKFCELGQMNCAKCPIYSLLNSRI